MAWQAELLFAVGSLDKAEEMGLKGLSILDRLGPEVGDTRAEKAALLLSLGRIYEFSDKQTQAILAP